MNYVYSTKTQHGQETAQTFSRKFHIYRAGHADQTFDLSDKDFDTLIDELGSDGWELVAETVRETTVVESHYGWDSVGTPIRVSWIFKRLAE